MTGHSEDTEQGGEIDTGAQQSVPDLWNLNSCVRQLVEGGLLVMWHRANT